MPGRLLPGILPDGGPSRCTGRSQSVHPFPRGKAMINQPQPGFAFASIPHPAPTRVATVHDANRAGGKQHEAGGRARIILSPLRRRHALVECPGARDNIVCKSTVLVQWPGSDLGGKASELQHG